MMKKLTMAAALIVTAMFLTGCLGYPEYATRTGKPNINASTDTEYSVEDYTVLGTVEATVESKCILGLYVVGEDGQGALMAAAREQYDGVTGIKDVSAVKQYEGVLPPVYMTISTTYYGVAVQE